MQVPSSSQYFFDRLCTTFQSIGAKPNEANPENLGRSSAANEGRIINEPILSSETDVRNSPENETGLNNDDLRLESPFPLPQEEADRMLSYYWLEIGPQIPIFDENEFGSAYRNLWKPQWSTLEDPSVEIGWNRLELMWDILLVDMVVTQYAAMRNMSGDFGEEHFERARNRLGDIFMSANFGSMRCLILMVKAQKVLVDGSLYGCITRLD